MATVVHLTHGVTPFDISEGAQYLRDTPNHFPDRTIFACVVFPETGVAPSVAVENERGQIFVAPDNGLLTDTLERCQARSAFEIQAPAIRLVHNHHSFDGRDVIVSAAAHLAAGWPLDRVGPRRDPSRLVRLAAPQVDVSDDGLLGEVRLIDKNYGNVWTNIPQDLAIRHGFDVGSTVHLLLGKRQISVPFARTFGAVDVHAPLVYVNSRGDLSIALNQGNFARDYGVTRGTPARILRSGVVTKHAAAGR
jgi:S-adenosylmethionine hydrolase